jgi:hypothetical protein
MRGRGRERVLIRGGVGGVGGVGRWADRRPSEEGGRGEQEAAEEGEGGNGGRDRLIIPTPDRAMGRIVLTDMVEETGMGGGAWGEGGADRAGCVRLGGGMRGVGGEVL